MLVHVLDASLPIRLPANVPGQEMEDECVDPVASWETQVMLLAVIWPTTNLEITSRVVTSIKINKKANQQRIIIDR